MSEKRKPLSSILLRPQGKKAIKVEFFPGEAFTSGTYTDLLGKEMPRERQEGRYRLRVAGKWFPKSHRVLYTKREIGTLLLGQLLGGK